MAHRELSPSDPCEAPCSLCYGGCSMKRATLFLCAIVLGACTSKETASSTATPALDAADAADAGGQPSQGDATDDVTPKACSPTAVPADIRTKFSLSAFYTQYVDVHGFPIIASSKTTPRALCVAR